MYITWKNFEWHGDEKARKKLHNINKALQLTQPHVSKRKSNYITEISEEVLILSSVLSVTEC